MSFVRVIRKASVQKLEDEINEIILENKGSELVDIKYSSSYNDNAVVHTAIIIFRNVLI